MVEHPSSPFPRHGPSKSQRKTYRHEARKPPPCAPRHSTLSPCSATGHGSSAAASRSSPTPAQSHSPQKTHPDRQHQVAAPILQHNDRLVRHWVHHQPANLHLHLFGSLYSGLEIGRRHNQFNTTKCDAGSIGRNATASAESAIASPTRQFGSVCVIRTGT